MEGESVLGGGAGWLLQPDQGPAVRVFLPRSGGGRAGLQLLWEESTEW
jgi:hypothetical protein